MPSRVNALNPLHEAAFPLVSPAWEAMNQARFPDASAGIESTVAEVSTAGPHRKHLELFCTHSHA